MEKNILEKLLEGNQRFVEGKSIHPNQSVPRRLELAGGQKPPVAVLACADSRVAPEIVFDQGLGDLFVVRVAGNLANEMNLGSLEYAVDHLGTRLILVLGHKRCGAVAAACAGGEAPGHVGSLLEAIGPALKNIDSQAGDRAEQVGRENVCLTVRRIRSAAPILSEAVQAGRLDVAGSYYDIDTGEVEILD